MFPPDGKEEANLTSIPTEVLPQDKQSPICPPWQIVLEG